MAMAQGAQRDYSLILNDLLNTFCYEENFGRKNVSYLKYRNKESTESKNENQTT